MIRRRFATVVGLLLCTAFSAVVIAQAKPDANGTWKWSSQGRQGGNAIEWTLKLKQEGDKLTGNVTGTFGGTPTDAPISDGTIKGDEIAFTVVRERGDQKFVSKYAGKLDGDTIKGKTERDRNGEKVSTDWEAKRVTEAASQPAMGH
jgi:hypothetical protein